MAARRRQIIRSKRLRYWIATQVNRLPGQCWTSLVTWAEFGSRPWPWAPIDFMCRRDARENDNECYCGKLRPGPEVRRRG